MKKVIVVLVFFVVVFGVFVVQLIIKEEVKYFKLIKVGLILVGLFGGEFFLFFDLYDQFFKLVDEKGGKYYVIIVVCEYGFNFEVIVEVYK